MLMLLSFWLRHQITAAAMTDLLSLASLHCPMPNICTKTIAMFRKFFRNSKIPMNIHKYCSNCFAAIKETQLPHICCTCNAKLEIKTSVSYFVELDIVTQLQNFFRKPGFTQLLQYRFEKAEKQSTIISDIYDGCQYKKLFPGGPLDNPNNLTFSWNTDGVPLFKSSNFGSWPFFLSINELPPGKRFLWDHQILGGLWFGPSKPFMNKFLNPLYKKVSKLETEGTIFYIDAEDRLVRAFMTAGTCDLPAKCLVQTQFSSMDIMDVQNVKSRVFTIMRDTLWYSHLGILLRINPN